MAPIVGGGGVIDDELNQVHSILRTIYQMRTNNPDALRSPYQPSSRCVLQEIKLWSSTKEREEYDSMADVYAIIQTVEHLERAWIGGVVKADEYTSACARLISQFRIARRYVPDVEDFMRRHFARSHSVPSAVLTDQSAKRFNHLHRPLNCPRAVHRLLKIGVPATTEHAVPNEQSQYARHIADAAACFITAANQVQLKLATSEVLHPVLSDLMRSVNRIPTLPPKFEGKEKIKDWLVTLNQMKPTDSLTEDQASQFVFDMEKAHGEFYALLENPGSQKTY
ncbi:MAG: VPS28 protein-domain-containing protein [Olpidium bornovanus]|uniref:Vacuolar protein sorting-associated protein 28 n=1 Tax=Olpidium bornovanus TaxID=278681 RepID=A0A8H8DII2_9FUNG|nr:MAG: VPS28 protein-domain-containing protein [Olpidium bornovanus]